ncbi:MAG TPA: lectin [Rhodocyclaceae bacterium]|jgi:hypothetical protein|nr:lectin [Rhodocyclaceae bacterium]
MKPELRRIHAAALCVAAGLSAGTARAGEQFTDLRSDGNYRSYSLPEGTKEVELSEQLAGHCRFNRTWGYDLSNRELWVNGGCSGRFKVVTDDSPLNTGGSNVAVGIAAAAAIAGIAILASRNHGDDGDKRGDDHGFVGGNDDAYQDSGYRNEGYGASGRNGNPIRGLGGYCLDIEGGVRAGSKAILFRCTGGPNQRFYWGRGGELRVGGLCLDVEEASRSDGARAIAWRCNGQRNQKWRVSGGEIRSAMSGKCLDVLEGRSRSGQPVILWECNGQRNQRWSW